MTEIVPASGGLVIRKGPSGPEFLVVHRPRYDDWSLPKGKNEPGEPDHAAAIREVEEETGYRCRPVGDLSTVEYGIPAGMRKRVRYYRMLPIVRTPFKPNDEVDQIRWVNREAAVDLLSYARDRALLNGETGDGALLYLTRHAAAGSRTKWEGDDRMRPLSAKGRRQADDLATRLTGVGVERILTSPYTRCVETVEPLAGAARLSIDVHDALAEGSSRVAQLGLLEDLRGTTTVVSSHGDVIPDMLDALVNRGVRLESPFECKKASMWVVDWVEGRYRSGIYLAPP